MKNKASSLMILATCAMLVGCTRPGGDQPIVDDGIIKDSPYSLLNGKKAKKTYETLTSVGIGELNYMHSSAAQNAEHFANFVDGLLTHNDFGTLELNLAESVRQENEYKEFIIKVRDDENLVWVTAQGEPYKFNGQVQKVTAADFVYGAKLINTFSVASDTGYLMRDFIKGAAEYFVYTELMQGITDGTYKAEDYDTNAKKQKFIYKKIIQEYPNVYKAQYDPAYGGTPITAADIPNVANGSRLGVKLEGENSVRYSLLDSAMYFPTLLTYSTYLPVNQNFYEEKGASKFGKASPDSILYCGPYILSQHDETNIAYKKNPYYAKRQDVINNHYKQALVENVHFSIKSDIESGDPRIQFEQGNIDGFSLSPNDTVGWNKYVLGEDNSGSIENPASGLVNSRWLDTISNCYGSNLVLERSKNSISAASHYSGGTEASVKNTERALRIQEVRQMLLATIDYRTYYERYSAGNMDDILGVQRLVSTYVPRKFVYDDNGNDYVEEYYANALADYKEISKEEAQEELAPGQYETRQLDWYDTVLDYNENEHQVGSERAQIQALVNKAVAAINEYNASPLAATYGTVSFPVNLEYYSTWFDQETQTWDNEFINAMNRRYNNWADDHEPAPDYSDCTVFKMVPTDEVTKSDYEDVSGSTNGSYAAYDFSVVQWGWGADYGDPLTYMNTYVYGGDWSSVFAYVGFKKGSEKAAMNIRHNPVTNALEAVELLEEYSNLVEEGKGETLNLTNRYSKFAEAEVKLIEELAIYKPQVNYGQGWSLSISNSAGYEMPTSNYGLSNDRMTGMYVLEKTLTSDERRALRQEQEAAKQAWVESHPAYNIYG